ncbi:LamG-like jellyroll fold domain-containing protein [uncultured Draconibacterium sp.]|uniref:LamG-like jellyroll fold domain-containing protein n=1 Tax=uncultured Draconibacterium sp. TaxID=1573823 RepID=UPI0029C77B86|nr:LamG-like jellyroll fold domain-containing protein [uncultured Draconibacterium sp.]
MKTLYPYYFMILKNFNPLMQKLIALRSKFLKRIYGSLLAIFFISLAITSNATVYYVSANGNDANTGTSPDQAWQSLDRVNSLTPSPGDQILFDRGGQWYGTINLTVSGSSGNPIEIGAYGTGAKPILSGFTTITSGWTNEGNGIFSYPITSDSETNMVAIDGVEYGKGREPNADEDYWTYESYSGRSSITDNQLSSSPDWDGADLVKRSNDWSWDRYIITSHSGTTINYTNYSGFSSVWTGVNGNGYFIQNDLRTLDQFGEWYHDEEAGKFYLYFGNRNPNEYSIQVATKDELIYTRTYDYITITDLDIRGSIKNAINTGYLSNNITVQNCDISYAGYDGIHIWGSNGVANNNTIHDINQSAIRIIGASSTITYNKISRVGIIIGSSPRYYNAIMNDNGAGSVVSYNTIENVGYNGILLYGENTKIQYNFINRTNLNQNDGGGIYTSASTMSNAGMLIDHNIVLNTEGNSKGGNTSYIMAEGIYLDEYSNHITVSNNTVAYNGYSGIKLHKAHDIVIENNISFKNGFTSLFLQNSMRDENNLINNTIRYNQFVNEANVLTLYILDVHATSPVGITSDHNYWTNPSGEWRSIMTSYVGNWDQRTLSQWQNEEGKDVNSSASAITIDDDNDLQLLYNNTNQNKTFNLGGKTYYEIDGSLLSGSVTLESFTSKILFGSGSITIENESPVISDQIFSVQAPLTANQVIGQVVASDNDPNQTLNYEITEGNTDGLFTIDAATGEILVSTGISTSEDLSYIINVQVSDDAVEPLSASATITIIITGDEEITPPSPDVSAPSISSFSIPLLATSLTVEVSSFIAMDDQAVTGYMLTETSIAPAADDQEWTSSVPTFYTFSEEGIKTLYAWAIDAAGNISTSVSATVTIRFPDLSSSYSEYLFEEGSGTAVIDSKGSNDGTIMNEEIRVEGIKGDGLQFTGAEYITLGQCFGDNVQTELTLSAWIKPSAMTGGFQGILLHGGPSISTFALYIYPDSKAIAFKTAGTSNSLYTYANINDLWDGDWHQVVVTYDGAEKKIYLDSEEIASVAASGDIQSGEGYNLLIGAGRDEATPTLLYEGLIDEVRIFNYALGNSEVTELYNLVNTISDTKYTSEYIELCEGESYNGWTESGEYQRTLTATSGADSIVTTSLTVNPVLYTTEEVTINEGEVYNDWTESGEYQRTLTAVTGCDSIVTTNLTVLQGINTTEYVELCEGESYNGWTESGEYQRTLTATSGADSVVTTLLTVNPVLYTTEEVTINEGEIYNGWTESGEYQRVLTAVTGCDSIVTTKLSVLQGINTTEYVELCEGESYNGWTESGEYERTLTATSGADSVVTTFLTVNPVFYTTEEVTINEGEVYNGWTESGEYQRILTAATGCDSIVTTILTVESNGEIITQSISLTAGWNIFSSYLSPASPNMEDVFETLRESGQLIMVEDENGNTYKNDDLKSSSWTNTIGNIEKTEGYKIQVNSNCQLNLTGTPIELPLVIELNEGVNIISFPLENSVNAMDVVLPLIDKGVLVKVQDEKGNAIEEWKWWKWSGWRNKIRNFESGEGYKVEVNTDCTLEISDSYHKSGLDAQEMTQTDHFMVEFNGNGSNHMNINIGGLQEANFIAGDEIAAFDGSICVGAIKLTGEHILDNSVSINASVADDGKENGFIHGNTIELHAFNSYSKENSIIIPDQVNGDMTYQTEASVFVLLQELHTGIEDSEFFVVDIDMYPNPAKDKVNIRFSNMPIEETRIVLMDLTGKELASKFVQSTLETFDLQTYPNGIYLVKTMVGNHYQVNKLIKN